MPLRGTGSTSFPALADAPLTSLKVASMLTIAIILVILWALGLITSYTMGGLIHILLVIAIIVVLVRVIQGRKVL